MELAIAVAVGCGVALLALLRGGTDPARSIVDFWGFRPLGWQTGVQEDDDLHWSWVAPAGQPNGAEPSVIDAAPRADPQVSGAARCGDPASVDAARRANPELFDSPRGEPASGPSMRVDLHRVTYTVRSVDRARS
jgi:hypothetical protein